MTDVLNDEVPDDVVFAEDHTEALENLDEMALADDEESSDYDSAKDHDLFVNQTTIGPTEPSLDDPVLIPMKIDGHQRRAEADQGASASLINHRLVEQWKLPTVTVHGIILSFNPDCHRAHFPNKACPGPLRR
jgi:hypothetical protein